MRYPVSHIPIPPLSEFIALNEAVAHVCGSQHPAKTLGIALNTTGLDDTAAQLYIASTEQSTGLPATDVVRFGVEKLVDAIP